MANGMFKGGDGSVDTPYLIEDAHDLFEFCSKTNTLYTTSHAYLVSDIDLGVAPFNTGQGFAVAHNTPFNGVFDGDGYIISNYFCRKTTAYSGLFPFLGANGVIRNFGMVNINHSTTGLGYMAIVCSVCNEGGLIENIYVNGGVFQAGTFSGVICGQLQKGKLRNVYVYNVVLQMYGNYFGGVCGIMGGTESYMSSVWASNTIAYISNSTYCGAVSGGWSGVTLDRVLNITYSTRMNYGGYIKPANVVAVAEAILTEPANMTELNASQPDSNYTRWILKPSTYPMLWFEDFRSFLILNAGRPITHMDFGSVLEGGQSSVKKIRIKNGYQYRITGFSVGWERADGVSDLTALQFSLDGTFTDIKNPMNIVGANIKRGREFDLYVRVKTYDGVTGAGQFNITVTVTSAE